MADVFSAAQQVAGMLARTMPPEVAAAGVHTGAVVQHAVALGLVEDHGSLVDTARAIAAAHPSLAGIADPAVNRAFTAPGADVAAVSELWQRHSVADEPTRSDGYLLGDLYQALSTEAAKGRALCQTPHFVTELLLELALEPARRQWGAETRVIDPACGTGHILVEAFISAWAHETGHRDVGMILATVHGVDIDPYAALVARYRLLALACRMGGRRTTLAAAPREWAPRVACANSLLDDSEPLLERGQYHVVLANPPYITVKDAAVNAEIRRRYAAVCHMKYSLAAPFFALMTELAIRGGWVAQLTTNAWMKREYGKRLVEEYLPKLDLRWVIDTSGAYIPGHGTPTVILVHRNQPPTGETVATVMGKRGEPTRPADPAKGLVWSAIAEAVRKELAYERLAEGMESAGRVAERVPVVEQPVRPPEPAYQQPSLLDLLGWDDASDASRPVVTVELPELVSADGH